VEGSTDTPEVRRAVESEASETAEQNVPAKPNRISEQKPDHEEGPSNWRWKQRSIIFVAVGMPLMVAAVAIAATYGVMRMELRAGDDRLESRSDSLTGRTPAYGFHLIETTPTWRMVVAPAKGTFKLSEAVSGVDLIPAGAEIGAIANLRDTIAITSAHGGEVIEWLVEDGDLVSPGQPLLRLHPTGAQHS
jgi:biotin carboxyl carrier protein